MGWLTWQVVDFHIVKELAHNLRLWHHAGSGSGALRQSLLSHKESAFFKRTPWAKVQWRQLLALIIRFSKVLVTHSRGVGCPTPPAPVSGHAALFAFSRALPHRQLPFCTDYSGGRRRLSSHGPEFMARISLVRRAARWRKEAAGDDQTVGLRWREVAFTSEKGLTSGTNGNQKLHAFQFMDANFLAALPR